MKIISVILAMSMMLVGSSAFSAEPARDRADRSVDPRRSYAAINVIMYQTSW